MWNVISILTTCEKRDLRFCEGNHRHVFQIPLHWQYDVLLHLTTAIISIRHYGQESLMGLWLWLIVVQKFQPMLYCYNSMFRIKALSPIHWCIVSLQYMIHKYIIQSFPAHKLRWCNLCRVQVGIVIIRRATKFHDVLSAILNDVIRLTTMIRI